MSIEEQLEQFPEEFATEICKIRATIRGKEYVFDLSSDLSIEYDSLEFELDRFPQIYHLWAMVHSEVRSQLSTIEKRIKRRKSALFMTVIGYDDDNKKMDNRIRRRDIDDVIESDDDLLKLDAEYIRMHKISGKLYLTLEALKMKNDNMRTLSGFRKSELGMNRK